MSLKNGNILFCTFICYKYYICSTVKIYLKNVSCILTLCFIQVERTFNMVSRALNLYEDPNTPPRTPLSDIEFRAFLDTVGQINNTAKLREVIYCGGIDPSLRLFFHI